MSTIGRPPKPTALKALHKSRQPVNKGEPKPRKSATAPAVPSWLDEDARKIWRSYARRLHQVGLLTELDTTAFAMLCETEALYRLAVGKVAEYGATQSTPNGYQQVTAWITVRDHAWKQMRTMLAEFGMTPSSRSRVVANAPREKSEFEQYLERKNRQAGEAA